MIGCCSLLFIQLHFIITKKILIDFHSILVYYYYYYNVVRCLIIKTIYCRYTSDSKHFKHNKIQSIEPNKDNLGFQIMGILIANRKNVKPKTRQTKNIKSIIVNRTSFGLQKTTCMFTRGTLCVFGNEMYCSNEALWGNSLIH